MQDEINTATATGRVNFAGKYLLIEKVCGNFCQDHAVVDATNGKIVALGMHSTMGVVFEVNSRLLTVNPLDFPIPSGAPRNSPRYYEMKDDGFHYLCESRT
jgi:hypothetical protein